MSHFERSQLFSFLLVFCLHPAISGGATQEPSVPSAGAEARPSVTMEMLLERTIFRIDVLTLRVRLTGPTALRLKDLVGGGEFTEATANSAASIAAHARQADTSLRFHRDIPLNRLLDGIRSSSLAARDAGYIKAETHASTDDSLPEWYAFLEGRGVRDGDELVYRINGDTLHILYRTAEDQLLLDRTDTGEERRLSVLGGYFAPGSEFRKGLLRSLFH